MLIGSMMMLVGFVGSVISVGTVFDIVKQQVDVHRKINKTRRR